MKLKSLVDQIQQVNTGFSQQASKAINRFLTLRNWLIGYYIVEFEQHGEERSTYGDKLIPKLAEEFREKDLKGLSFTNLNLYRQFYIAYPEIEQIFPKSVDGKILQSVTEESIYEPFPILQSVTEELEMALQAAPMLKTAAQQLELKMIDSLSFTHITLLIPITQPLKRTFYTIEAIKGTWSVRELRRQINALLYERSGISIKPELLLPLKNQPANFQHGLVKDIYTFEFLGLPFRDAVEESDLEMALLDHLREFILELGHGFCLETRQKRILIGNEYYFIDLVFYHRILKCHILIELKVEEFNHANAGQLNTYLNYFKKEIKVPGDNDPIGILLVTHKNEALVEYATAGMDQNLFVSKYLLQLPDTGKLASFLRQQLENI